MSIDVTKVDEKCKKRFALVVWNTIFKSYRTVILKSPRHEGIHFKTIMISSNEGTGIVRWFTIISDVSMKRR